MEIAEIGRWALVIFMYVFCLIVSLVVVGTGAQHARLDKYMSDTLQNIITIGVALALYTALLLLVLNNWAAGYLRL